MSDTLNRTEKVVFEQKEIPPVSPFGEGYVRPVESSAKLLSALVKAMGRHPQLRMGQLIYAAMAKKYAGAGTTMTSLEEMKVVGDRLFTIYDETLTEALSEF